MASIRKPALPWRDRFLAIYRRRGWRGFVRLLDFLKPVHADRHLLFETRFGSRFSLSPWDIVDGHVIREGFYESEVLLTLSPHLQDPNAVLWVVGANFGLHAITAKHLHPHVRVVAFEPSPAMGLRILDHCKLNHLHVELHCYALSDRPGIANFHANDSGNPGMSTLHPTEGMTYDQRFTVATYDAHTLIKDGRVPPPTTIILDAEGAEEAIIRGLGSQIAAPNLRHIVFESCNDLLDTDTPSPLLTILRNAGFTLQKLERLEKTAHTQSNFLAAKP